MAKRKDIDKVLGEVVRKHRISKNISQEKLAEIGNFERSYISKVETAARSVRFVTVVRLAKALDIKPSDLVKEIEAQLDMT